MTGIERSGKQLVGPPSPPDPILTIEDLRCSFGGLLAVSVDHLEVQRGSVTALIGPNGAGKTTLFNLLTGFQPPNSGQWTLDGQKLAGLRPDQIATRGMVRTFQLTKVFPGLTVLDNMRLGAPDRPGRSLLSATAIVSWRRAQSAIDARADDVLERFGLASKRTELAGTLSGGQRKLLEMARALMREPRLLMLDEPMAGVNPVLAQELMSHVRQLAELGTTVVFVEHDMQTVMDVSDWVVVMSQGRPIAQGTPDAVAADTDVIDAYLGTRATPDGAAGPAPNRRMRVIEADPHDASPGGDGPPARSPLLEVEDLVAGYVPGADVVRGCSLLLEPGEVVAVIGPNGAGKSTLLKTVFGLVPIRQGRVRHCGTDISNVPTNELVAMGIGYVPQSRGVFPNLTVGENLEVGGHLARGARDDRLDYVADLFPLLAERARMPAGLLSGGERQMLAMGRALMMRPSLLLLDEPSAGLSPGLQEHVFEQVLAIAGSGVAVLLVEQNARRCLEISHRGYVLDQGRDAHTGRGCDLLNDPRVVELYLGTSGRDRRAASASGPGEEPTHWVGSIPGAPC